MKPRTCRNSFSSKVLGVCLLSISMFAGASSVLASNSGKVVVRENVSTTQRQELIASLKIITGWSSLRFDQQGVLQVGREPAVNGSATARSLLGRAVDGDKVIVLEDASSRLDVAFCRVVEARWLTNTGTRMPAFVVLIDFADFHEVIGDKQARAAFNVGWGVLHELDHVVSDSTDADERGLLGECETHINAMRREIGLPVRADYFYIESTLKADPNFNSKLVRLSFEQYDSNKLRTRRYWIVWDARVVGGLSTLNQTAAVQAIRSRRN
ncbi:MAG TPA: hypothetical protein VIX17_15650 [Pyrinomonadaceae bacterium]